MLFRQRNAIDAAQLEELRRQDARRALERECRLLRRLFTSLEKDHKSLRAEHDFQSMRLDSMVVQSGALLTLINGLSSSGISDSRGGSARAVAASYGEVVTIPSEELAAIQSEKQNLTEERARLLRKNMDLELQFTAALQLGGEDTESRFTGHGAAYNSNISPIPESDELELRSGTWVGLANEDLPNLVVK
jgi:hypothetical protein